MNIRQWLLSSVICGGLVVGTGISVQATASPSSFEPNSQWAISKIEAQQAGGLAYCAMARRFNDKVVLTLARNIQDESSVAIDFLQGNFDVSHEYKVSIDAGFNQKRTFSSKPVSARAQVLHLGKDYAFYDALNRSDRLEIEIDGKPYRFFMGDVAQGQKQMNGCLATLIEPAAGVENPPSVVSVSKLQIEREKESSPLAALDVAALDKPSLEELVTLRSENRRLRSSLNQERQKYEDIAAQKNDNGSIAIELKEKIKLLERDNFDLLGKLQTVQTQARTLGQKAGDDTGRMKESFSQEVHALKAENKTLQEKITQQQQKISNLSTPVEDPEKSQALATIERLNQQIEGLSSEKVKLQGDYKQQLQLVAELQEQVTQNAANVETLKRLNVRLASLEGENKTLQVGQVQKTEEFEALKLKLADATKGQVSGQEGIGRLNDQINVLIAQNKTLQGDYELQATKMVALRQEMVKNEAKGSKEVTAINDLNNRLGVLEETNKQLQVERDGKAAELVALNARFAQEVDKSKELLKISRLSETVKALRINNENLKATQVEKAQDFAALQNSLAQSNSDTSKEKALIASLQKEMIGLKAANEKLSGNYQSQSEKLVQLTQNLALAHKDVAEKQGQQNTDSSKEKALVASLQKEMIGLKATNEKLSGDYQVQSEKLAQLTQSLLLASKAENVNSEHGGQLAALSEELAAMKSENESLRGEVDEKSAQLVAVNENMLQQSESAPDNIKELATIKLLNDRLEELLADNKILQSNDETKGQELARLYSEVDTLKNAAKKSPVQSVDNARDLETIDRLNRRIESIEAEKNTLHSRFTEQNNLVARLRSDIATKELTPMPSGGAPLDSEEMKSLMVKIETLTAKNSILSEELTMIGGQDSFDTNQAIASLSQLKAVEAALYAVEKDRDRLAMQLEKIHRGQADDLYKVAGNNWDLEQATNRYNEAERQIRDLGGRLEKANVQCAREKKELEYMLFDPEVAEQAQISKLLRLENELASLKPRSSQVLAQSKSVGRGYTAGMNSDENSLSTITPMAGSATERRIARNDSGLGGQGPSFGNETTFSVHSLQNLLKKADLSIGNSLKEETVSSSNIAVYSWDTESLFGSAEQVSLPSLQKFDDYVNAYISKTENHCKGDFAAVPVMVENSAGARISSYEMVCMGGQGEAAAALVFFNRDGVFTAIAHETNISGIEIAMDARDRLVHTLLSSQ